MASKTKRMNVLVYSGHGSTVDSVKHCLYTLRRLLSPNYAVMPINESVISKEPWTASCALLVFPGGADLGYAQSLNGEGNLRISQYVRRGGAYLGLCAGGYYGSSRCEFEVGDPKMEVVGKRELAFYPGTCRGCAFKGFVYHSENGAKAVELKSAEGVFKSYYNGGGVFVDAGKYKDEGVEVLATYAEPLSVDGGDGEASVVYCKVGEGGAVLTGPHPEFAAVNLNRDAKVSGYSKIIDALAEDDGPRTEFMKACLAKLGLQVTQETNSVPSLSRLHLSSLNKIEVSELLESLQDIITTEDREEYIKGENDIFHIEKSSSRWSFNSLAKSLPSNSKDKAALEIETIANVDASEDRILDYDKIVKRIVPHESEWPALRATPYFNHSAFFANLQHYQSQSSDDVEEFGKILMYGEVVTSTNTILEKNSQLLANLPTGFTACATIQVSGRGRGNNVWVTPNGSMCFTTIIKHPAHLMNSAPVTFIQYLAGIAMVEGIKSYDKGYENLPVRLKWPNDIYAEDPNKPGEYLKIGGILVNSTYTSGNYNLCVGIGINTLNAAPSLSLNALLPTSYPSFALEKLLARVLTKFEDIYKTFCRKGWDRNIEERYYKYWLHTDQIVTLEQHGGARARIVGVSRDWGLLRAEEVGWEDRGTGKVWELQGDSNSFDFFRGLLRRKV